MRKITLVGRTAADDYDVIIESDLLPDDQIQLEFAAMLALFKKNGIVGPYRQKSSSGGGGNQKGWLDIGEHNVLLICFPYKGSKDANQTYQKPILEKIKQISKQSPRGDKIKVGNREEYVYAIGGGKLDVIKAIIALPEFSEFERRKALQDFLKP